MSERKLMKGNEAMAEAAIRAGCRFYFGYPITPQNEITEYMSKELKKVGGSFVQAESEIAAINMCHGAAAAGGRVFTSSSSPGVALMQEAISGLANVELPVVIINVMRAGPGIGGIQPGQADYFQATRGGGNGDYRVVSYAPATIQESLDMIRKSFEVADEWRNPVMVLADGMLGQMMEPVTLPDYIEPLKDEELGEKKPWALTGHKDKRDRIAHRSVWLDAKEFGEYSDKIWAKYERMEEALPEYENLNLKGAEIVFVAFGTTSRIVKEAIEVLKAEGISAGLIRPKTLWPYPTKAFDEIDIESTKIVISVELSRGQLIQDVKLAIANQQLPTGLISRIGGNLLNPADVVKEAKDLLKEVK